MFNGLTGSSKYQKWSNIAFLDEFDKKRTFYENSGHFGWIVRVLYNQTRVKTETNPVINPDTETSKFFYKLNHLFNQYVYLSLCDLTYSLNA